MLGIAARDGNSPAPRCLAGGHCGAKNSRKSAHDPKRREGGNCRAVAGKYLVEHVESPACDLKGLRALAHVATGQASGPDAG